MTNAPEDDGDDAAEWVDITTLASTHHTQLNVCTGEIRHRRPARFAFDGNSQQLTTVEEDDWTPGHPPD